MVRFPSACIPLSPDATEMFPPVITMFPLLCTESSAESILNSPPLMFTSLPAFKAFADVEVLSLSVVVLAVVLIVRPVLSAVGIAGRSPPVPFPLSSGLPIPFGPPPPLLMLLCQFLFGVPSDFIEAFALPPPVVMSKLPLSIESTVSASNASLFVTTVKLPPVTLIKPLSEASVLVDFMPFVPAEMLNVPPDILTLSLPSIAVDAEVTLILPSVITRSSFETMPCL